VTQEEMQLASWERVESYVWVCMETGKFHFVCETEMLDDTPFDSLEECIKALNDYSRSL
jgi:hypothetical protein